MKYTWINARCSTLSRLCEHAADLMNHDDPADRYAVTDLLQLVVDNAESLITLTEGREGSEYLIDARYLAGAARYLYSPHDGGATNNEAAAVAYQAAGVLQCAENEDYYTT